MAYNLKEVSKKPERFTGGHRMCAGCGAPVVVRQILRALKTEDHAVIGSATGCLEVCSFIYPYTAWKDSFIHNAFENSAATIAGVEAAYNAMKRKGSLKGETKFIAFGGDGGTYDIGLQSLSGAMERGHDMLYVCYDNGAYMNTGIQRSSATPMHADTTTSPAGKVIPGKQQWRKDLTEIIAHHNVPYACQTAAIGNMKDLYEKSEKAIYTKGPTFMNVFAPCPRGWQYNTPDLMEINKLAVESCFWPLYEIENGKYTINYVPKNKIPVTEFLRLQGRFKHLFKAENEELLQKIQAEVDKRWEYLLKLAEMN
jgi:pyruvate ferredoxin oxidoreductase beta subunit